MTAPTQFQLPRFSCDIATCPDRSAASVFRGKVCGKGRSFLPAFHTEFIAGTAWKARFALSVHGGFVPVPGIKQTSACRIPYFRRRSATPSRTGFSTRGFVHESHEAGKNHSNTFLRHFHFLKSAISIQLKRLAMNSPRSNLN